MYENTIVFSIFVIFFAAAILSTVALFTRQSLLIAYMLVGLLLGPWGLGLVSDSYIIKQTGDIGIVFLLFLLGLNLQPQNLWNMLRKVTLVACISSIIFSLIGFIIAYVSGFQWGECLIIGAAMMFSSTIVGLKLLPSNVLHHQHTGEVMISLLLMQDFIAIFVLLLLNGAIAGKGFSLFEFFQVLLSLPTLLIFAYLVQRYILIPLFSYYDRIREYMFLLSIAWCLSLSELANLIGLSHEVGAFIAGVSLASSRISLYIAESLKPLRDFFLILFFFSVGASFDLIYVKSILLPACLLALSMILVKPYVFQALLYRISGESRYTSWEIGWRLGQISEFSLLVAYIAGSSALFSDKASYLVQATTMITFIVSSYIVIFNYPTPMASQDILRKD